MKAREYVKMWNQPTLRVSVYESAKIRLSHLSSHRRTFLKHFSEFYALMLWVSRHLDIFHEIYDRKLLFYGISISRACRQRDLFKKRWFNLIEIDNSATILFMEIINSEKITSSNRFHKRNCSEPRWKTSSMNLKRKIIKNYANLNIFLNSTKYWSGQNAWI